MSTMTGPDFKPPLSGAEARRRRRNRLLRNILIPCCALLLVAGGVYAVRVQLTTCGLGALRYEAGECVGVTDGSVLLNRGLRDVQDKIEAENDRVLGSAGAKHTVVTVAVLTAVPAFEETAGRLTSIEQVRAKLEGAYLAQAIQNNKFDEEDANNVWIRLVLANEGSQEQFADEVVDKLKDAVHRKPPLVAVTGLGVSVQETVDGAKELAGAGIPMVGAVLTADGLNKRNTVSGAPDPIEGLYRVSPSNRAEVVALRQALGKEQERSYKLVYDRNESDFYTSGLRQDFQEVFGAELPEGAAEPYDGSPDVQWVAGQFDQIAAELCGTDKPDTVLYAGRSSLLSEFVDSLGGRSCAEEVTVVTGSDAAKVENPPEGVHLVYAALADPGALADPNWNPTDGDSRPGERKADRFKRFRADFERAGFSSDELNNGWAIMEYDAMIAVANAAETAVPPDKQDPNNLPGPKDVEAQLSFRDGRDWTVAGAGDDFYFDEQTGDPVNRAVHVIRKVHDQPTEVMHRYVSKPG